MDRLDLNSDTRSDPISLQPCMKKKVETGIFQAKNTRAKVDEPLLSSLKKQGQYTRKRLHSYSKDGLMKDIIQRYLKLLFYMHY